jgi:hypothetical protein
VSGVQGCSKEDVNKLEAGDAERASRAIFFWHFEKERHCAKGKGAPDVPRRTRKARASSCFVASSNAFPGRYMSISASQVLGVRENQSKAPKDAQ